MIAIISLLVVILMSILITRVATIALAHTGLTKASAKFQARSAFSGAGFTTSESEMVVNHPVRRKIVMLLILLGNAELVTAVSSLILTFVRQGDSATGSIAKRSGSRRRCSKKKQGKTVRKNEIEQLNDETVFYRTGFFAARKTDTVSIGKKYLIDLIEFSF